MEKEQETNLTNDSGNVVDNTDYVTALKELKENSVDRQKYDALLADRKRLIDSIVNGQEQSKEKEEPKASIEELRKELFKSGEVNLKTAKAAVALRKAIMENGGEDPFVPQGRKIAATDEDYACAQRTSDALEHCIEVANGDSDLFTMELQRIMIDTGKTVSKRK